MGRADRAGPGSPRALCPGHPWVGNATCWSYGPCRRPLQGGSSPFCRCRDGFGQGPVSAPEPNREEQCVPRAAGPETPGQAPQSPRVPARGAGSRCARLPVQEASYAARVCAGRGAALRGEGWPPGPLCPWPRVGARRGKAEPEGKPCLGLRRPRIRTRSPHHH